MDLALAACDATDPVAMDGFGRELVVTRKPDRTFVTEVDQAVELRLRERIRAAHPDHGLVGEEYGMEADGASVRWYVDPIDGTHNYLRGVPVFATLLAVEREGELQAAVISAPALGSRWFGYRGGGAWQVGPRPGGPRRLRVSGVAALTEAQVLYGDGPGIEASGAAPGFRNLLDLAWRTRGFGDFWGYTLVAEGAAEAMVEEGLSPWDVAAPMLIVEEAGGALTDLAGARSLSGRGHLASNGLLHAELLARLAVVG
jgi:histidinol-phosphatase